MRYVFAANYIFRSAGILVPHSTISPTLLSTSMTLDHEQFLERIHSQTSVEDKCTAMPPTTKVSITERSSEDLITERKRWEHFAEKSKRENRKKRFASLQHGSDPSYSVKIKFKYGSNVEEVELYADMTIADVALIIFDRLKINPWQLRLITSGKKLVIDPSSQQTIKSLDKKLIRIVGTPYKMLQAALWPFISADYRENYYERRVSLFGSWWNYLKPAFCTQLREYHSNPAPTPIPDTRAFGLMVPNYNESVQANTSFMFGLALMPELDCNCPSPKHAKGPWEQLTAVGCRTCIDTFLVKCAIFIKLRLNFLLNRAPIIYEKAPKHIREKEIAALEQRRYRFLTAFANRDEDFLDIFLEELQDIEETLDFDPDIQEDKSDGRPPADSDNAETQIDMWCLDIAITICLGVFDREKEGPSEENTGMTRHNFMCFPSLDQLMEEGVIKSSVFEA